ncbi:MAG: MFS transporter [Candidatus Saccharicenans sp.]|uniref:MFS transporter n=1 Tax=Candidatus Saccharicenans sp. TaxID=2819258 RepID=UPI00404A63AC
MKQKILLSASLFHALTDAATIVTPTIFPILYSQAFLIKKYSQIGLLSNLGLITTILIQFWVVALSFRYEYRFLMLASGLGICLANFLIPLSLSFTVLMLLFVLLRGFTSFYHPVVIAWISRSRSGLGRELDDAMGIQSGSGNLGVLLAFVTTGYLAQHFGWKAPLYIWAAVGLVITSIGVTAINKVSSQQPVKPDLSARNWLLVLKKVSHLLPGFFFGGMGWSVTVFYAPSLLHNNFNIPMGQTGVYLALWIGLGTITGYLYGFWSRKFGRKRVFLTSLAGATLCLLVIGFSLNRSLSVVALLLFGGFLLMTYPSLHTFVGSTVRDEDQTQAFSWISNIQMVSGAVISLISGFLSDLLNIRFPFILAGILSLAVFLFYLPKDDRYFGAREIELSPGKLVPPGV